MFETWTLAVFLKTAQRTDADVDPPERFRPTQVSRPPLEVDLRRAGISTVLFATGFQPDYGRSQTVLGG